MKVVKALLLISAPLILVILTFGQKPSEQVTNTQTQAKNTPYKIKEAYIPGEIIVKFKTPIDELSGQASSASFDTLEDETSRSFSDLNRSRTPRKLQNIDSKYKINQIEKIHPAAESPKTDLQELKTRFKAEIASGEKTIDEKAYLAYNLSTTYKITFSPDAPVEGIINDLTSDTEVEYAEPNYLTDVIYTPNDPLYPMGPNRLNQWYLENPGRNTNINAPAHKIDADIDASSAWDITKGSPSIVIGIIDTGIDYTHPDLGGKFGPAYKVMGGYDFANSDTDPMDDHGHGTHVAGIVAATGNNSAGISGTCPDCRLMALKTNGSGGTGSYAKLARAVTYAADNGVKILNISLGGPAYSNYLNEAIQSAYASGVVIVAAAGNNGNTQTLYPAAHQNVIAVANLEATDIKANGSNYGSRIDISAPGSSILSTAMTGLSCGTSYHESGIQRYSYCGGTSMASPVVAGVVGLMRSNNPSLSAPFIKTKIKATADNIDNENPEYIGMLGAGRINAYKALTKSIRAEENNCENGRCTGRCRSTSAPNGINVTSDNLTGIDNKSTYKTFALKEGGPATITWDAVPKAKGYHIRVDYEETSWIGYPGNDLPGCDTDPSHTKEKDSCLDITNPKFTYEFEPDTKYQVTFITDGWCRNISVLTK